MSVLSPELVRVVRAQYALPWRGIHGVCHWARVRETGLRLAAHTGADPSVVELFAVLHDSRRRNEGEDPGHGGRGADLAATLRGTLLQLSDAAFALLHVACVHHTSGLIDADVTVQTCWDADRLDLGRVGIVPNPARLCTAAARDPAMREWAYQRSLRVDGHGELLA